MKKVLALLIALIAPFNALANINTSVVKIGVERAEYNLITPWASPSQSQRSRFGFIISGDRVITNAHIAAFIEVRKAGSSKKYPAKVKNIIDSTDLAILEVKNSEFFKDTIPFEVGRTPLVENKLTIILS